MTTPDPLNNALSVAKKITGETLTVYSSGNKADIKSMMHGEADALVRAYNYAKRAAQPTHQSTAGTPSDDPIAKIEALAALRDKGLITAEEFETKKTDILSRM